MEQYIDEAEAIGRAKFEKWVNKQDDVQIIYFTKTKTTGYDVLLMSGGTMIIGDVKDRTYDVSFFNDYGCDIDYGKCDKLRSMGKDLEAIPMIFNITKDDYLLLIEVNSAKAKDVREVKYQNNNWQKLEQIKRIIRYKKYKTKRI